jgi:hypothetical protein
MSKFGKAVKEHEYLLLVEEINFNRYKWWLRQFHHLFPRATKELDIIALNFAHRPINQIYAHGFTLNRKRMAKQ